MSGENVKSPVQPGDKIAGKFLVERLIGSGGVGVVVAARHLQLEERVAIKFLLPRAAKNVVDVARFCREAQAASKLKTEHVSKVLDTGVLEDGAPYMVMEYLEGKDLHEMLKSEGPPPVEHALELVLQAGVALAEAHLLGIVHRDIKPSNLFLTTRTDGTPLVKVLDFGIAKASVDVYTGVGPQELTKTSALLGSPLYMSPEQIRSTKSVDARSDIWSLGVVMYELFCGSTPFDSESLTGVVAGVIGSSPPPLGMRRADIPPGLVAVVNKCLEKEPENRYNSMAELAAALEPFAPEDAKISVVRILRLQSAKARTESPWALTPSSPGSTTGDVSEPPSATARTLRSESGITKPARRRSRPMMLWALAFALPMAFGTAVWYGWHARQIVAVPLLPSSADTAPIAGPVIDAQTAPGIADSETASSDAGVVDGDASAGDAAQDDSPSMAASAKATSLPKSPPTPLAVTTRNVSRPATTKSAPKGSDTGPAKIVDETVDTRH